MFQQKDHLKSHLPANHPNNNNNNNRPVFQCQECGKQYNTQLGYRRHLLAAHGPAATRTSDELPPCLEGVGGGVVPSSLLLEQLGGHASDRPLPPPEGAAPPPPVRERKYSCERCDRRFYTRKDVRRHAVVHTGRRDFLCPRCAQRFGRRDHLTRHLKKSHAQEAAALTPLAADHALPPAATPSHPAVKEEPSPVTCDMGTPSSKEPLPPEAATFPPLDMYNSYPLQPVMSNPGLGPHHHHSFMQGSLSTSMGVGVGVGRHMPPPPSPHHHHPLPHPHHHLQPPPQAQQQQQPSYASHMPRYQHAASTSYPHRTDIESFLMDLQSGLPPHLTSSSASSSAASPQREVLQQEGQAGGPGGDPPHLLSRSPTLTSAELSCAANMDLGPLLGFLPFGLPPYSAHMSMGGLVMGYPATSTSASAAPSPSSSSSSSTPLHSQAPGPFTLLQPPQAHPTPQGLGPHHHNQLPQGFSSPGMSTSSSLPRYYQAFQQ